MSQKTTNTSFTATDTFINFDKLIDSPEEAAKVHRILQQNLTQRNTMSFDDFKYYISIFQYDGRTKLGDDEYEKRCNDYFSRICPFDPVNILDDDDNILFTLPPVFKRTNPINYAGRVGVDIATAFINASASPDEFNHKKHKYCELYKQALDVAQNKEEQNKIQELSDKLTTAVLNKTQNDINNVPQINPEIEDLNIPNKEDIIKEENNIEYL